MGFGGGDLPFVSLKKQAFRLECTKEPRQRNEVGPVVLVCRAKTSKKRGNGFVQGLLGHENRSKLSYVRALLSANSGSYSPHLRSNHIKSPRERKHHSEAFGNGRCAATCANSWISFSFPPRQSQTFLLTKQIV